MKNVARLQELFVYCPKTGVVVRKVSKGKGKAGDIVGTIHSAGYLQVRVDGVWEYVHRIAYALTLGVYPEAEIDHINGDPKDNRWANLRAATHAENMQNKKQPSHSTQPYKGVRRSTTEGKWVARIRANMKEVHIGTFASAEEAYGAYRNFAEKVHPYSTER